MFEGTFFNTQILQKGLDMSDFVSQRQEQLDQLFKLYPGIGGSESQVAMKVELPPKEKVYPSATAEYFALPCSNGFAKKYSEAVGIVLGDLAEQQGTRFENFCSHLIVSDEIFVRNVLTAYGIADLRNAQKTKIPSLLIDFLEYQDGLKPTCIMNSERHISLGTFEVALLLQLHPHLLSQYEGKKLIVCGDAIRTHGSPHVMYFYYSNGKLTLNLDE